MKQLEISIVSESELPMLAKTILQFAEGVRVFAFYAPMGAGKTTLIKELCQQIGSRDSFSSPTYGIANEYLCGDEKIFHLDLYRLVSLKEAYEAGVEEYISGNDFCFIEWPEIAEPLLPANVVRVTIKAEDAIRHISLLKQ